MLQLSYGLSSEYQAKPVQDKRLDAIDPDAQVFSKYYLSQILQLDEQGIRDAWHKVRSALLSCCRPSCCRQLRLCKHAQAVSTRNYGEKDQRLEHLSWRVSSRALSAFSLVSAVLYLLQSSWHFAVRAADRRLHAPTAVLQVWFMKRARSRVAWEEGRRLAATLPDENEVFDDYTSEEDDLLRSGKQEDSPRSPKQRSTEALPKPESPTTSPRPRMPSLPDSRACHQVQHRAPAVTVLSDPAVAQS